LQHRPDRGALRNRPGRLMGCASVGVEASP
jgi:hypothetical protein